MLHHDTTQEHGMVMCSSDPTWINNTSIVALATGIGLSSTNINALLKSTTRAAKVYKCTS